MPLLPGARDEDPSVGVLQMKHEVTQQEIHYPPRHATAVQPETV